MRFLRVLSWMIPCVLIATGAAFAEPAITTDTLTQAIDVTGRRLDKIAEATKKHPAQWVFTDLGGERAVATAYNVTADQIRLSFPDTSRFATAILQRAGDAWSSTMYLRSGGASMRTPIASIYGQSADDSPNSCAVLARPERKIVGGMKCHCDLARLRALQGAVGMTEVMTKRQEILDHPKRERRELAYDPIKIVRGPDELLYVTDHHHGALAWLKAGHTMGTCAFEVIEFEPSRGDLFFKQLIDRQWIRIKDQNGKDLPNWAYLPMLKDLPDDPYRTLAWMVRKRDGYCRAHMQGKTEFAEFRWADWFRPRLSIDLVSRARNNTDPIVDAALRLAGSPEARDLPGYRVEGFASPCPPDPV